MPDRETDTLEIRGQAIEVYREPLYGDELYIDDNQVKVEMVPGEGSRPKVKSMTPVNRNMLRLTRAVKTIDGKPVTREDVLGLRRSVVRELTTHLDGTEWADLGEAQSPGRGQTSS